MNEVAQITRETLEEGFKRLQKEWNAEPDSEINQAITRLKNALVKNKAIANKTANYTAFSKAIGSSFKGFKTNATAQLKFEVYEACNHIIDILLNRNTSLNYAIYYTDENHIVHRMGMETMNEKAIAKHSTSVVNVYRSQIRELQDKEEQNILALNKHYLTYHNIIKLTYKGIIGKGAVNEGHIAEAFERHLQDNDSSYFIDPLSFKDTSHFDIDEIWQNVRDSLGNAGWWTGGDVGMTQVKAMIGKSSKVRLSRVKTIEEVANLLIYLYDNRMNSLDNLNPFVDPNKDFIDYLISYFSEPSRVSNIDKKIDQTGMNIIKEAIKAAENNELL